MTDHGTLPGGLGSSPVPPATRPRLLDGVKVVEFGRFVAAPLAARLLGDFGADVIKVEGLSGDPFRTFVQRRPGGFSSSFTALNRNKRSLAVDVSRGEGRAAIARCIESADVFIENSRPGTMAKLGLDYESMARLNPRLIFCSITGFGESGPYVDRPGYDMIGQAVSGMASQLLDPERPQVVGPNLSDSITGMTAALSIVSALHARGRTGQGQRIALNLVGSSLAFLGTEAQRYLDTGVVPGHLTRPSGSLSFALTCADGEVIALHLSSPPKFWAGLLQVIDRPGWAADPRFASHHGRQAHYLELRALLEPIFVERSIADWLSVLVTAGVPCAVVNDMAQVFDDEQVRSLGLLQAIEADLTPPTPTVGVPVEFFGTSEESMLPPPGLGQHGAEILASVGYSASSTAAAQEEGWLLVSDR